MAAANTGGITKEIKRAGISRRDGRRTDDIARDSAVLPRSQGVHHTHWPAQAFPANKKENRGSPALCVSGNFQGKQRVFGAPFWKLASFPESESWSGAKSEAKLRKSTKYPGGRRVNSRYARVLRKIPGILPIWPKIWLILGPNQPQTRLRGQSPKFDDFHAIFPGK